MRHLLTDNHPLDNVVDVSLDEIASTRHDAVVDLVNGVRDAWQSRIVPLFTNVVSFTGGHYQDLDSLDGVSGDFGFNGSLPHVGPSSAPSSPPNVAYLVAKHCSHTRRQRPGRMYLGGVDETVVDGTGLIGPASLSSCNAALENFRNDLTHASGVTHPGTTAWRVVHIAGYDGVPVPGFPLGHPNAWNSSDVSSAVMDARVATQRRRLR
jgi:hypothetical protein